MHGRRNTIAFYVALAWLFGSPTAHSQGYGEQSPPQFRYSNQGLTNEVYRQQFSAAAAASAKTSGSSGSGSSGPSQSAQELNNVVQINNNSTYNLSISGSSNLLSFDNKVDAAQRSDGTSQSSSNAGVVHSGGNSSYLNR
jgi:hypothetical protein